MDIGLIEKSLIARRAQRIDLIPKDIRKQLKRIEKTIFFMWELDHSYTNQVALDCFDLVRHNQISLNELESIIKSNGKELSVKMGYYKALKYIVKNVRKSKKLNALRNKDSLRVKLKSIINGN